MTQFIAPLASDIAYQSLETKVTRMAKEGTLSRVICVSVLHMRQLNYDFGHRAGDRALTQIKQLLAKRLPPSAIYRPKAQNRVYGLLGPDSDLAQFTADMPSEISMPGVDSKISLAVFAAELSELTAHPAWNPHWSLLENICEIFDQYKLALKTNK